MGDTDAEIVDILASMVDDERNLEVETWLALLKRKGVYPYEWMSGFENFQYPSLPPKVRHHINAQQAIIPISFIS